MKMKTSDVWSIILAGGNGSRMQPFIRQWLGRNIPKQYCSFVGKQSLFQHTLKRADQLTHPEQKITVISRDHQGLAIPQMTSNSGGAVLLQPRNCDTGPGLFLPLSYLKLFAPEATVIIFPSDHFIFPVNRFLRVIAHAVNALEQQAGHLILLGARPTTPEMEYGWIKPDGLIQKDKRAPLYQVHSFIEKPTASKAQELMNTGGLWNTMIVAGKLSTFWNLGWLFLPHLMQKFRAFQAFIGSKWERTMLEHLYQDMPMCNLSHGLLQKIPEYLTVMELRHVLWSDWGQPERIVETLRDIGKKPNFSSEKIPEFSSISGSETSLASIPKA